MSAPIRQSKMAAGKVGVGKIRNAGSAPGGEGGGGKPMHIKNAVGMCEVGGQGYAKIKGAVSG